MPQIWRILQLLIHLISTMLKLLIEQLITVIKLPALQIPAIFKLSAQQSKQIYYKFLMPQIKYQAFSRMQVLKDKMH